MRSGTLFNTFQLVIITTLLQISTCSPVTPKSNLRREELLIDQKRQGGFFSVLGSGALADNALHSRLEIRQLEKNQDQWNVFLLGLIRFQNITHTDKLSYYQIAGIHGRPFDSWDGVRQGSGGAGGYCTHGSIVFLTWHRAYLALFEEMLCLNARQAISELPESDLKTRYTAALDTLRMPYWDWAAVPPSGEGVLPYSLQKKTVDIPLPNGTITVPNPLYSYEFPSLSAADMGSSPWTIYPSTLRDPTSTLADAASRNDMIALEFDKNRPNVQSRTYGVLGMQHDYLNISNDRQPGDSLESVHDTIHNIAGNNGHMSYLSVAAFDPIFWLHHTNVDRLLAIWQALNPSSYVIPNKNPYATFTMRTGFEADIDTPLTPFHKNDAGEFWTSESVRSTDVFAYTYPELVGLGNNTSSLVAKVNALYGPSAVTPLKRSETSDPPVAGAPTFKERRQYTVNIKAFKFCNDGSFNVYIFLGTEPGSDAKAYTNETSFIGMTGILSQPMGDDNSKDGIEANGAVPLTPALESKRNSGEIENLSEDVVRAYLRKNLKWRVSKMDGTQVPVADVQGFEMSVLWAEIEPAKNECEFPRIISSHRVLLNATNGLGSFSDDV